MMSKVQKTFGIGVEIIEEFNENFIKYVEEEDDLSNFYKSALMKLNDGYQIYYRPSW